MNVSILPIMLVNVRKMSPTSLFTIPYESSSTAARTKRVIELIERSMSRRSLLGEPNMTTFARLENVSLKPAAICEPSAVMPMLFSLLITCSPPESFGVCSFSSASCRRAQKVCVGLEPEESPRDLAKPPTNPSTASVVLAALGGSRNTCPSFKGTDSLGRVLISVDCPALAATAGLLRSEMRPAMSSMTPVDAVRICAHVDPPFRSISQNIDFRRRSSLVLI